MKKVILGLAFSAYVAVGFMSCTTETCYKCTHTMTSTYCDIDICSNTATASGTGTCTTLTTAANLAYDKNDDIKGYIELAGYTCTKK